MLITRIEARLPTFVHCMLTGACAACSQAQGSDIVEAAAAVHAGVMPRLVPTDPVRPSEVAARRGPARCMRVLVPL